MFLDNIHKVDLIKGKVYKDQEYPWGNSNFSDTRVQIKSTTFLNIYLRCDMEENKQKEAGIGPCATKKIGILVSSVLILRDVAVVVGIDVVLLVVALLTVQMRKCETVLQSLVSVPFRMDSPLIGDQVQEV